MADRTRIPIVQATWNPVTGCNRVSPGCRRCYARSFARRLAGRYGYPKENPFTVTVHPSRLHQPLLWVKSRTIFACSMGDLFHTDVDDATLNSVFSIIAETARHTYLILTKRPARMAAWLRNAPKALLLKVQSNLWLGVSVEDQQRANERLPLLIRAWPGRRIACLEPLLDGIDLSPWLNALDWVIAGGETGSGGRQADAAHLRVVRDQCVVAGIPLFFKQWGGRKNKKLENTLDGKKWEQLGGDTPQGRSNEPSFDSDSGGDAGSCRPTARGCLGG